MVLYRDLWPTQILVAINRFSHKVVCVVPLEGPNAEWIIEVLERAIQEHGAPKYIIYDQTAVFVGVGCKNISRINPSKSNS